LDLLLLLGTGTTSLWWWSLSFASSIDSFNSTIFFLFRFPIIKDLKLKRRIKQHVKKRIWWASERQFQKDTYLSSICVDGCWIVSCNIRSRKALFGGAVSAAQIHLRNMAKHLLSDNLGPAFDGRGVSDEFLNRRCRRHCLIQSLGQRQLAASDIYQLQWVQGDLSVLEEMKSRSAMPIAWMFLLTCLGLTLGHRDGDDGRRPQTHLSATQKKKLLGVSPGFAGDAYSLTNPFPYYWSIPYGKKKGESCTRAERA
jgi:hypothetical protein